MCNDALLRVVDEAKARDFSDCSASSRRGTNITLRGIWVLRPDFRHVKITLSEHEFNFRDEGRIYHEPNNTSTSCRHRIDDCVIGR